MPSDYIAPTRNSIHLSQMSITQPKSHTKKLRIMSVLEYHHLLIMTLCGFVKGEGQSLCYSVCRNRKGRRGSN